MQRPPRLCLISRLCNRQLLKCYVGLQVALPHAPRPNSKRCFSSHKRNLASPSLTLMCYSLSLGMARYVDPLVVGRVIGDVVDLFVPTVSMTVRFGSKHVSNGCDIKPSVAANPPTVQFAGQQSDLYTLVRGDSIFSCVKVMTDPDAPCPSDPTMREWLHWMVVNMPGRTDPSQGEEVVPYMGPRLPLGIHRYVLVLFRQKSRFPGVTPPATRVKFNTRSFAAHHDLGLLVATVYLNSQKEPAPLSRQRHNP
ncbi:unnamed protein product [Musa textilis]